MLITENRLKQIIREEVVSRILDELIDEELDKFLFEQDKVDREYDAAKRADRKSSIKKTLAALGVGAALGTPVALDYADYAKGKSDERAASELRVQAQQELSGHALEEVNNQLKSGASFMWSLDSKADKETVGVPGQDFQDTVSKKQNYPLFQDYMGGSTQMMSGERGVLQKLYQDIQNQIAKGVIMKADLKPGIDPSDVRAPSISADQYKANYKDMYDMPDFNPAKVDKEDIEGNQDRMQTAATKISPEGGFEFMKAGGKSYGYETYELLDTVNPELPNSKMSPSEYYIKMFNKVTGQNIGK